MPEQEPTWLTPEENRKLQEIDFDLLRPESIGAAMFTEKYNKRVKRLLAGEKIEDINPQENGADSASHSNEPHVVEAIDPEEFEALDED